MSANGVCGHRSGSRVRREPALANNDIRDLGSATGTLSTPTAPDDFTHGGVICSVLRETEKDDSSAGKVGKVIIVQSSDALTKVRLRDRRDLVHHEAAGRSQPILVVRCQFQAKQGCFGGIGRARNRVTEDVSLNWSDWTITAGRGLLA